MSTIGQGPKSRRKKSFLSDRSLSIGFKDIPFQHQALLGDTGLNLNDLTLPDDTGSFENPTPSQLASINLNQFRSNIEIHNGSGQKLKNGGDFEVNGTQITFKGFTALDNEVFEGVVKGSPRTSLAFLDGKKILTDGFLQEGDTLFNVGEEFKYNFNSGGRTGKIKVTRNRTPQYRNSNNGVNGEVDGDYNEIQAGSSGVSTLIEFNDPGVILPDTTLEFVEIESTDVFVDRETGSLRSEIEAQQGSILRLAESLAEVTETPGGIDDFISAAPATIQQKQFGDILLGILDIQVPIVTEWQTFTSVFEAESVNPTKGTIDYDQFEFRQVGDSMEIHGSYRHTTAGVVGNGRYFLVIPDGQEIDLTKVRGGIGSDDGIVGSCSFGASENIGNISVENATQISAIGGRNTVNNAAWSSSSSGQTFGDANIRFSFHATVPIVGFQATQTLREHLEAKGIL